VKTREDDSNRTRAATRHVTVSFGLSGTSTLIRPERKKELSFYGEKEARREETNRSGFGTWLISTEKELSAFFSASRVTES
jgi:hypothetical protein